MSKIIKTIYQEHGEISSVEDHNFKVFICYDGDSKYSGYYKDFLINNVHPTERYKITVGTKITYCEYYEDNQFGTRKHCLGIIFK